MIDPAAVNAVLVIVLPSIKEHRQRSGQPFVLGLSGLQGGGKSTWAAALCRALREDCGYNSRTLSIDDLYHDHKDLVAIKDKYPDNKLLRTRGQPGTHDEALAQKFFADLFGNEWGGETGKVVRWPAYDKSLHQGQGGRVPEEQWEAVSLTPSIDVIIFEGWCLGFQPLSESAVTEKWIKAKASHDESELSTATLADHKIDDLLLVNKNLRRYCEGSMAPSSFDGFLHLTTDNLANVYEWRLDQERTLRKSKPGMTDGEVIQFVRGYMPGYELFLDRLQNEYLFGGANAGSPTKKHVQVKMDKDRSILSINEI